MANSFERHNSEVKEVWESYHAGNPIRVPMILGLSERSFLSDPSLNTNGITYYDYHNNVDIMMDIQLQFQDYIRHNIYADHEMGLPQEWKIKIDGGNFHHSAWYGCKIHYTDIDSPDTISILNDDNKNMLFEKGIPDPFSGVYSQFRDMYEQIQEKIKTFEYKGVPISADIDVPAAMLGGNGVPFTTACKLRGTTEMCMDMALDPGYSKQLLEYVTEAVINRTKAWRKYLGLPVKTEEIFIGDDSIILLSPDMYREFVAPCHKRIFEEFGIPGGTRAIHLCGNASRHFEILVKELGVNKIDTGFPVKLGELYASLGKHVTIQGGLHIELIRNGTREEIYTESKRILEEVKPFNKFIFRDANHLAPCTPAGNMNTMYEACKEYGKY